MPKEDRLDIRIDPQLKEEIKKYSKRNHESISSLVNRFFVRLLEEERKRKNEERGQI